MPEITGTNAAINQSFYWICLFIGLNITSAWFSPGWTDKIGEILYRQRAKWSGFKKRNSFHSKTAALTQNPPKTLLRSVRFK